MCQIQKAFSPQREPPMPASDVGRWTEKRRKG